MRRIRYRLPFTRTMIELWHTRGAVARSYLFLRRHRLRGWVTEDFFVIFFSVRRRYEHHVMRLLRLRCE